MWKRIEEITAYNDAQGIANQHDPFAELNTVGGRVDGLFLEGEYAVIVSCCETLRVRREDIAGWRAVTGRDGARLFDVRVRANAPVLAQRAVLASREPQICEHCGRGWEGPPPPRAENGPDAARRGGDYPGRPRDERRDERARDERREPPRSDDRREERRDDDGDDRRGPRAPAR